MPMPKSVMKINKDGVKFESSVDKLAYTLEELSRAALRDVGKFVAKETRKSISRRTGRLAKNTQYWARKRDCDLQVGFKPGGWYGMFQELGSDNIAKVGALQNAVNDNIPMIIMIESKYLSGLESEARALSMIDEGEGMGDE